MSIPLLFTKNVYNGWVQYGPVVKWYYIAFALRRREFDSRQVHIVSEAFRALLFVLEKRLKASIMSLYL